MSNFPYNPAPTAGQVRCKSCGAQKPRSEFPVIDNGKRLSCNCNTCHAWARALASVQSTNKEEAKCEQQ